MELLVYTLMFIFFALVFGIIGLAVTSRKQMVVERLDSIKDSYNYPDDEDEMKKPFRERVIEPAYQKVVSALGNITPSSIKKRYESLIVESGKSRTMTVNSILAVQLMLSLVVGGGVFLLFQLVNVNIPFILIFLFGVLAFFIPYALLHTSAMQRQAKIQKALPDLLDLLYISVEAGLGFDMALKKSTEKMPGPLSDEIIKALDDISKGRDRQEALRGIVRRTGVEDLNTFITAVIQSEMLGTNIASMLRTQSTVMRQKRRQRAEEAAMKIPIKMLFPLVFFMMPALFVVILGPAVISIIENLGKIL